MKHSWQRNMRNGRSIILRAIKNSRNTQHYHDISASLALAPMQHTHSFKKKKKRWINSGFEDGSRKQFMPSAAYSGFAFERWTTNRSMNWSALTLSADLKPVRIRRDLFSLLQHLLPPLLSLLLPFPLSLSASRLALTQPARWWWEDDAELIM